MLDVILIIFKLMENNNKLPNKTTFYLLCHKSSPTSNSRFEMSKDRKLFVLWISDYFKD